MTMTVFWPCKNRSIAMSFSILFTLISPRIDAKKKGNMMAAGLFPILFLSRGQTETYMFLSEELPKELYNFSTGSVGALQDLTPLDFVLRALRALKPSYSSR